MLQIYPQYRLRQHDAPLHYSPALRQLLDEILPKLWIGGGGPTSWPPRSRDLTPLDLSFCGYVKHKVYKTPCPTFTLLKRKITTGIRSIQVDTLQMYEITFKASFALLLSIMAVILNTCNTSYILHLNCER